MLCRAGRNDPANAIDQSRVCIMLERHVSTEFHRNHRLPYVPERQVPGHPGPVVVQDLGVLPSGLRPNEQRWSNHQHRLQFLCIRNIPRALINGFPVQ